MGVDIIPALDCASAFGVYEMPSKSRPSLRHRLILHGETDASCACEAWQNFKGEPWDRTCPHMKAVWDRTNGACLYNMQWCEGIADPKIRPVGYTAPLVPGEKCPACGGPVVAVRRAV